MIKAVFVSQSIGRASSTTSKILDAYAIRIGAKAWTTSITSEALECIKKALSLRVSKKMSVACHVVKSGKINLAWIVGNRSRFSADGSCSLRTRKGCLAACREAMHPDKLAVFGHLVATAGLVHDLGKSTAHFQKKLKKNKIEKDPIRHDLLTALLMDPILAGKGLKTAFSKVEPLVQQDRLPFTQPRDLHEVIRWLVLTHHRLPSLTIDGAFGCERHVSSTDREVVAKAARYHKDPFVDKGLALRVASAGERLTKEDLGRKLTEGLYMYGRLAMMMGDHIVSGFATRENTGRAAYFAGDTGLLANSDGKQDLARHLIGVQKWAGRAAKLLPAMTDRLPGLYLEERAGIDAPATAERFDWQNDAARAAGEIAVSLKNRPAGVFTVLCAGTGSGKTRGGARVASALAGDSPLRLTTLLGLRSLTLQTGDAYRKELSLSDLSLATLIGSREIRELHEADAKKGELSAIDVDVCNGLHLQLPKILDRFAKNEDEKRLIGTPALVCTIDYLINAADWRRSYHLLPQLRLMSSDVILDEIDGYDLGDFPAIGRLCYLVGLFGRKLILSSATLMPEIADHLYAAYRSGWEVHAAMTGSPSEVIALFASNTVGSESGTFDTQDAFKAHYKAFLTKMAHLEKEQATQAPVLRGITADIATCDDLMQHALSLHAMNNVPHAGISVSCGMIRFARVRDVVWVAGGLAQISEKTKDATVKVLAYHSKIPTAVRSWIEKRLDEALKRHPGKPDPLPESRLMAPVVAEAISHGHKDAVLLVVASPVEEVGRDHDFDWQIIEPSSSRSVIQCSGRANRHRRQPLKEGCYNLVVLERNAKCLEGQRVVFNKPGYELGSDPFSDERDFVSYNTSSILSEISRNPRGTACFADGPEADKMPQWERKRIDRFLRDGIYKEFLADMKFKLADRHMKRHGFRAGLPTIDLYYDIGEGEWRDIVAERARNGDIEIKSKPVPIVDCRASRSAGWRIGPDDIMDIASKTADMVDADPDDARFSQRFMRVAVTEAELLSGIIGNPVVGLFSKKMSIFSRHTPA